MCERLSLAVSGAGAGAGWVWPSLSLSCQSAHPRCLVGERSTLLNCYGPGRAGRDLSRLSRRRPAGSVAALTPTRLHSTRAPSPLPGAQPSSPGSSRPENLSEHCRWTQGGGMTSPHGQFPQGLVSRVPHCAPYGLFTTLVLTRRDRIFWTEYQDLYCDTNHAKLGLQPPLGTRPSGLWAPGTLSPLTTSLPSQSHSTISCLG